MKIFKAILIILVTTSIKAAQEGPEYNERIRIPVDQRRESEEGNNIPNNLNRRRQNALARAHPYGRAYHGGIYRCEFDRCGHVCFTEVDLRRHLRLHSPPAHVLPRVPPYGRVYYGNLYRCEFEGCNRAACTEADLREHMKEHPQPNKRRRRL